MSPSDVFFQIRDMHNFNLNTNLKEKEFKDHTSGMKKNMIKTKHLQREQLICFVCGKTKEQ